MILSTELRDHFHSHPFKWLRMGFFLLEYDTRECQKRDVGKMVRVNQKKPNLISLSCVSVSFEKPSLRPLRSYTIFSKKSVVSHRVGIGPAGPDRTNFESGRTGLDGKNPSGSNSGVASFQNIDILIYASCHIYPFSI